MPYKKAVTFKRDLTEERLIQHLSASNLSEVSDRQGKPDQGLLAVDCEMMGLNPSRDRLCLVQICDESSNISLIQIEAGQADAPNLKKLLEHSNLQKIFHYGRADLAHLRYQLRILVEPIFCTKVASKLARTYTDRHSLREISREFLGIDLNKTQQSSDWGRFQLTNEQVEYASADVAYLIRLRAELIKILKREERLEIAEECFLQIPLLVGLDLLGYNDVFEH